MQPHEFVDRYHAANLTERSVAQSHFNDLCALLGEPHPVQADPQGDWFTFEKGVNKTTGARGFADVWRKGCFGWEYKGKRKNLDAAFTQLQQYAVALENPPLLIVSDVNRIRIHTNWTNTVSRQHEFALDDLLNADVRDQLKNAFVNPEAFKPAKTRQMLTEEAAGKFAALAERLRQRGHESEQVAHFINRLAFCMFAEDVGLLQNKMFQRLLENCRGNPADFEPQARDLFKAMRRGGRLGLEKVAHFNGGLFDTDDALPLDGADIAEVLNAAKLDWSDIDPALLGVLFERGLDPSKRSQLGAHYTDRDKIEQIIEPAITRPLLEEWAALKPQIAAAFETAQVKFKTLKTKKARDSAHDEPIRMRAQFLERLKAFRVLDPACGSGNFLNLALIALKDIEHRVKLDCETMGMERGLPEIGPENVLGIELNPYAAELARVSVWIGDIQWARKHGFLVSADPVLRPLKTIERRDAVVTEDGAAADWPDADVIIGNPPFLGNKKMIAELGEDYATTLRKAWPSVPGGADLVAYWFAKSWEMIRAGRAKRAGLVATNSIRGGANREVLKPVASEGRIFEAWSDEPWTVDGAAVRVSLVCFDAAHGGPALLDGAPVAEVYADLTANESGADITKAARLAENPGVSFIGDQKSGPFDISYDDALKLLTLPGNPNGCFNADVVRPWVNGMDITRRPSGRWIIDFGSYMRLQDACLYEAPFQHVQEAVFPVRKDLRRSNHRELWWIHGESRPGMRKALSPLKRYIATPRVAKHRLFVWLDRAVLPDCQLVAIARDDDTTFGVLHSRFHELWSLRMGTSLEDRPRYTPSTTFETFPFPEGLTPDVPAAEIADDPRAITIAQAAARLNELRENWLNPSDLIDRVPEVVPGYPDRILPKDEAAAQILKTRTLTNLYNQRPAWLEHAHAALDQAVANAYGWGDLWRAGMTEDEILARLFALNQARPAR